MMQSQSVLLAATSFSLLVVTLEAAVYGGSSWPVRRPVDRVYSQGNNVFSLRQKSSGSYHSAAVNTDKEYAPSEKTYGDDNHRPLMQDRDGPRGKISSPLVDSHNLRQQNEKLYSKPKVGGPLLSHLQHKSSIEKPGYRPPTIEQVYGKTTKKVKTGVKTEPEIIDGIRVGELVSVGTVTDNGDVVDIPIPVVGHPDDSPHQEDSIVSRIGSDTVDSLIQRQRFSNRRQETLPHRESDWRGTQTHNNGLHNTHVPDHVQSSSRFDENPWPRRARNERVQFDGPVWSDQHRIPKPVSGKITQGKRKLSKYDRLRRYEG